MVTIMGLIVLVVVVVAGLVLRGSPQPTPTASPTTSTPAASPTTSALPGQVFTTPDGSNSGRWEILDTRWTSEGVSIHVAIHADHAAVSYSFLAFANASAQVLDPAPGIDQPTLERGTVAGGRSDDGWVYFEAPRGDLTLILATGTGRQMSALVVKG